MKRVMLLVLPALFLCSCSSDDAETSLPEENFYALTVGNSWVYEHFRREHIMSDIFLDTGVIDSVEIIATELIEDETFFKFRIRTSGNEDNIAFCAPNGERFEYYRDSLGYLIDNYGYVVASREDTQEFRYRERTHDTALFTALNEGEEEITTTAGSFSAIRMNLYLRNFVSGITYPGLDRYYFSNGIGKVFNTVSFASEDTHRMERRLKSYSVD